MTNKVLIDSLSKFPDNADVVIVNPNTLERYNLSFITWKNSSERINIYYKDNNELSG